MLFSSFDWRTAAPKKEFLRDEELIARIIEGSKNLDVNLKTEDKEKISKYLELKENIKALEDEAKSIENNIKNELGEAEKGTIDEFIVNWRSICSSRIDSKLLKEKYPEVYRTVSKESLSRRFEIKLYAGN